MIFADRLIEKEKQLQRLYNETSWHLRDLIEKANSISELYSILDTIQNNYTIGTLRDIDYKWLLDAFDKKRAVLMIKEE